MTNLKSILTKNFCNSKKHCRVTEDFGHDISFACYVGIGHKHIIGTGSKSMQVLYIGLKIEIRHQATVGLMQSKQYDMFFL